MAIHTLKDGTEVNIRRALPQDIPGLYAVMSKVFREGSSMLQTEMPFTMEQLQREILQAQESNQVTYVATSRSGVVGWLRVDRLQVPFMRHVGTIWLGMDQSVRGQGLGESLIKEMLTWANAQQIEKIELGVRSSNEAAIRLYKKLGFIEEGRKIKAIRTDKGYEDDVWMGLFLKESLKPAKIKPRSNKKAVSNAGSVRKKRAI